MLAVDPAFRKRGLGSLLVAHVMKRMAAEVEEVSARC